MAALAGQGLVAAAKDQYPHDGATYSFVASFAEVEVDAETGKYYIVDFLAYADVGTVLHPRALGGQVLGRSTLGIGHAIGQKWVFDPNYGMMVSKRFHHSKPPTILDVPVNMQWEALDIPDPETPVGSRGIGEPPVGGGCASILNALSDALGDEIFRRAPVNADTILTSLESGRPMQHPLRRISRLADAREETMAVIRDVMPAFELYQPSSVADAQKLLQQLGADAWVMAGGLDSFDWLKDRIKRPKAVVDLSGVDELKGIRITDQGIEIGVMTTLTEVVQHPTIREKYSLLSQGAELAASPQIRNQGTIGGNVSQDARCWYYRGGWPCYRAGGNICYADTPTGRNREHAILHAERCVAVNPSDSAPAFIALDAKFVLSTPKGERVVDAEDYFIGPEIDITRLNILQPGDLLTTIRIPSTWAGAQFYFEKVRDRNVWDFALLNVASAMVVSDGRIERIRLAVNGAAARPLRLKAVEDAVRGKSPDAINR